MVLWILVFVLVWLGFVLVMFKVLNAMWVYC